VWGKIAWWPYNREEGRSLPAASRRRRVLLRRPESGDRMTRNAYLIPLVARFWNRSSQSSRIASPIGLRLAERIGGVPQ